MSDRRQRRAAHRVSAAQTLVAPGWWTRQHDPDSSLYLPTPLAGRNRMEMGWSLLSTLDGAGAASLDRRGAVALPGATWVLDWWFNHDGTWQRAAEAAGVRQVRTDHLPVAETRVRVGPNELVIRQGAAPRSGEPGSAWVTMEVEVDGPDPVGLAMVATPWTLSDVGRIDRVEVSGGVLSVNGATVLVAQRPPRAAHLVDRADDLVDLVARMPEGSDGPVAPVVSRHGTGGAALVWPMAHRSMLRMGLPLGSFESSEVDAVAELERLPDTTAMAKGWARHLEVGAALELPESSLTDMARAARAQLLAAADGAWFTGADPVSAALAAGTLARLGHADVVGPVVGQVARAVDDDPAGLAAVLEASLGLGVSLTRDEVIDAPEHLLVHLARALHITLRQLRRRGVQWWPEAQRPRLASMVEAAAVMADGWGQQGVADNARAIAAALPTGAESEPEPEPEPEQASEVPSEVSSEPSASLGRVRWVRREPGADLDLPATLDAARRDIAAGRPDGALTVAAVSALLERLGCWPDVVHPTRPLGIGEDGASVATMARLLAATLDLAAPLNGSSVDAFGSFPSEWWGRPAQFSDLPVAGGSVSCALRWHGARPALIWELTPDGLGHCPETDGASQTGTPPSVLLLRAPALDPVFTGSELVGEALLEVPPGAVELLTARAESAAAPAETTVASTDESTESGGDSAGGGSVSTPEAARSGGAVTMGVDMPTRRRPDGT